LLTGELLGVVFDKIDFLLKTVAKRFLAYLLVENNFLARLILNSPTTYWEIIAENVPSPHYLN